MLQLPVFSQGHDFKWGKESQTGLVWTGSGWQGYFSLDILEGMGFETETCFYFKLYGH